MKKVLVAAAAGLMLMLSVAACKSVEDKAKDYSKEVKELMEKGDMVGAMKVAADAAEWYDGLSDADKAKVDALDLDF